MERREVLRETWRRSVTQVLEAARTEGSQCLFAWLSEDNQRMFTLLSVLQRDEMLYQWFESQFAETAGSEQKASDTNSYPFSDLHSLLFDMVRYPLYLGTSQLRRGILAIDEAIGHVREADGFPEDLGWRWEHVPNGQIWPHSSFT